MLDAADRQRCDALGDLGGDLYRLGRYAEALDRYERALAIDPHSAWLHGARASVLSLLHRPDDAEAASLESLRLAPDSFEAWYSRSIVLMNRDAWLGAISAAKHAITIDPERAGGWRHIANLRSMRSEHDDALEALDRALVLEPLHAQTLAHRAMVLRRSRRYAEAPAAIAEALAIAPEDSYVRWVAALVQEHEDPADAAEHCRESLRLNPSDAAARVETLARLTHRVAARTKDCDATTSGLSLPATLVPFSSIQNKPHLDLKLFALALGILVFAIQRRASDPTIDPYRPDYIFLALLLAFAIAVIVTGLRLMYGLATGGR